MSPHGGCAGSVAAASRPSFDLGEIFRAHGEAFRSQFSLSPEQGKVMRAIAACRTAALGGHLDVCLDCGLERPSFNSCRNRHCPKCQALDQQRWLEQRMERILPTHYFHVVFTLPDELRALARRNPREIYTLLFQAASRTLMDLGRDPNRLGALLGLTLVLHTWTRDLRFHPHVHGIVTGGGLRLDGQEWVGTSPKFLFPVKVLSKLFRGKVVDGLHRLLDEGSLELPPELRDPTSSERFFAALYAHRWVVYAKPPFAGPEQVFAYLGRYTHRVALSNHRILDLTDDTVTIATRDGKTATMSPVELIRRFLLHILPKRFVKIRHYGLHASANVGSRLEKARELLQSSIPDPALADHGSETAKTWKQRLQDLTGVDPDICPACGSHRLHRTHLPRRARPPPPRKAA